LLTNAAARSTRSAPHHTTAQRQCPGVTADKDVSVCSQYTAATAADNPRAAGCPSVADSVTAGAQHSTAQHSTLQHSIAHITAQHSTNNSAAPPVAAAVSHHCCQAGLLDSLKTGRPLKRATAKSFLVCGSMPLAPSISSSALSAAASVLHSSSRQDQHQALAQHSACQHSYPALAVHQLNDQGLGLRPACCIAGAPPLLLLLLPPACSACCCHP
jgi:hypothetical protein